MLPFWAFGSPTIRALRSILYSRWPVCPWVRVGIYFEAKHPQNDIILDISLFINYIILFRCKLKFVIIIFMECLQPPLNIYIRQTKILIFRLSGITNIFNGRGDYIITFLNYNEITTCRYSSFK